MHINGVIASTTQWMVKMHLSFSLLSFIMTVDLGGLDSNESTCSKVVPEGGECYFLRGSNT